MDLDIEEGTLVTLLGPSGCGKTTLLRMVAGLEDPTEGDIFIKGKRINDTPIHKRNLGMIFQNYALFPHKTIFDNVAFGLKYRNVSKDEIREKVTRALEMVRLPGVENRMPQPALRRPAAAHRHGPGHRDRAGRAADGRAPLGPGRKPARRDAARSGQPAADAGRHHHLRDPRPARSPEHVGQDRGDERRPQSSRRATPKRSTTNRPTISWPIFWATPISSRARWWRWTNDHVKVRIETGDTLHCGKQGRLCEGRPGGDGRARPAFRGLSQG